MVSVTAALTLLGLAWAAPSAPPAGLEWAGQVNTGWSLTATTGGGAVPSQVNSLTFPFRINPASAHTDGIYVAQQIYFAGISTSGYLGIKPRPDVDGQGRFRARLGFFGPGSSTTHPNCYNSIDGGAGSTCEFDFEATYGAEYLYTVANIGNSTYEGWVTAPGGERYEVGVFTVPAGGTALGTAGGGFVEWWRATDGAQWTVHAGQCRTELLKIDTELGPVFSPDTGAYGPVSPPSEPQDAGDCFGADSGYAASEIEYPFTLGGQRLTGTGYRIQRGWAAS